MHFKGVSCFSGLNFKLRTPVKLEPILLKQNDVQKLLNFAREKGLSAAPHWQRHGITRINQFLLNLDPISKPLARMIFQLRAKIENTSEKTERLIFFFFLFAGMAIERLDCSESISDPDFDCLIHQLRNPIRRIYKLNSSVENMLESPLKTLRGCVMPLAKELEEEAYNYLLRMTPPPPTALEIPHRGRHLPSVETLEGSSGSEPERPILVMTSISTTLLISYEGNPGAGTQRVNSLPTRGGI